MWLDPKVQQFLLCYSKITHLRHAVVENKKQPYFCPKIWAK